MRTPSIASTDLGDPLAAILRPPSGESDDERQLRMEREAEAKRILENVGARKSVDNLSVVLEELGVAAAEGEDDKTEDEGTEAVSLWRDSFCINPSKNLTIMFSVGFKEHSIEGRHLREMPMWFA